MRLMHKSISVRLARDAWLLGAVAIVAVGAGCGKAARHMDTPDANKADQDGDIDPGAGMDATDPDMPLFDAGSTDASTEIVACMNINGCMTHEACFQGNCRQMCLTGMDCGPTTGGCCNYTVTTNQKICNLPPGSCNPFGANAVSSCPAGTACYFEPCDHNLSNADCISPVGSLNARDPCTFTNNCKPGFTCIGSTSPECRRVCRLGMDSDCVSHEKCSPVTTSDTGMNSTLYGYCS